MSNSKSAGHISTLKGEALNYWMYRHAAKELSRDASDAEFEKGFAAGQYQFATDKALVVDLMLRYSVRLQMIGSEWLASTEKGGQFGESPNEAACRLVVSQTFGVEPSL